MDMIDSSKLRSIPFIRTDALQGRFIRTLNFYDEGAWTYYLEAGAELVCIHAHPAESVYFAKEAEAETDIHFEFLDWLIQRANFMGLEQQIVGLEDDLFNLSASIAKIEFFQKFREEIAPGVTRMVMTEVEYIYSVCRSIFDLLQEIACKLWERITLRDGEAESRRKKKKKLGSTFSKNIYGGDGKRLTAQEIEEKFGLPPDWAAFYALHSEFFTQLRELRDNIIHNVLSCTEN